MYKVQRLNKICDNIYDIFDNKYSFSDDCENPDAIILRSYNMAEYEVKDKLVAIGRAGAGVNNIPLPKMSEKGVVVFNTPGANANAVKELVLCGMLIASRDVIGGTMWVNSLTPEQDVPKVTEKGKSNFGGNEISGKTIGVIGLGAIGVLVANMALCLGMKVVGYDPYVTDENKSKLDTSVQIVENIDFLYKDSDFISLHLPLLDSTKNMINAESITKMKDGAIVLNMSRAALVDNIAMKEALLTDKIGKYVVDFPTIETLNTKNIIVIPHLGASTEEAEDNCASMAAVELKDFIENGNIMNSVNFPNIQKHRTFKNRYTVAYKQGLEVLKRVDELLKNSGLKYEVASKDRGDYGYIIIDVDGTINFDTIAQNGILKVRAL